jgi:hypothetical protein
MASVEHLLREKLHVFIDKGQISKGRIWLCLSSNARPEKNRNFREEVFEQFFGFPSSSILGP